MLIQNKMIREDYQILLNSYLTLALNINIGVISQSEDFAKNILKIKNLLLSKNIHPEDVHQFIIKKLIQKKCSDNYIQLFFNWTML
jgi:hypothetical protein